MHSTTVAVDLAKNVFELAVADAEGKIGERLRLNRARFSSFFVHRAPCRVLMEAAAVRTTGHAGSASMGMQFSCYPRSTCASMSGATRLIVRTPRR